MKHNSLYVFDNSECGGAEGEFKPWKDAAKFFFLLALQPPLGFIHILQPSSGL